MKKFMMMFVIVSTLLISAPVFAMDVVCYMGVFKVYHNNSVVLLLDQDGEEYVLSNVDHNLKLHYNDVVKVMITLHYIGDQKCTIKDLRILNKERR